MVARPPATERVLVSLQGRPDALSVRAINRVVARYADEALFPADGRTPAVPHHTLCTLLARNDQSIDVIAKLASRRCPGSPPRSA